MITITTKADLINFLTSYKSAKTATVVSKTELKMNKKDIATKQTPNPYPIAYKVSLFEADINFDYEDRVNDARLVEGKEQSFEAGEAKWGQYVSKSLTKKDDQYYMKLVPTKSLTKTTYEDADGKALDYDSLKPFVPVRKESASTSQGLDNAVQFRAFKLDSIIHFKIPGVVEYTQE